MKGEDIFEYFKFKLRDIPIKDSYWCFLTEGTSRFKMTFSVRFLTENEASSICQLFTNSNNPLQIDKLGDILNPKEYIDYLTFQCPIRDNDLLLDGVLDGRFIIQIKLDDLVQHIREDKLNSILNI